MAGQGKHKPQLRNILILTHVLVLLLPLAGIAILRIYDNALVRQTQAELVSQAGLVATLFSEKVSDFQLKDNPYQGLTVSAVPDEYQQRVPPQIDMLSAEVLPPQEEPLTITAQIHPVLQRAGRVLSHILRKSKFVTLTGTRVVDIHGTIIASSGDETGLGMGQVEEVQRALKGLPSVVVRERLPVTGTPQPSYASLQRGSRVRLFVCLPVFAKNQILGAVVLSRTPLDTRKALYEKRYEIFVALALFLGVILIVSAISSFFVTRPVATMISQAEKLARGQKDWNAQKPQAVTEEVQRLSEAFESMAGTLEKRAEYIKQFAMHVSHEFKTPLSSLRGAVELLQDHWDSMPADKRLRFLSNVSQDSGRLERLVTRLMELAHAEVRAVSQESTPLDPLLENLRVRYQDQGLNLTVVSSAQPYVAALPADLLETVLGNLLNNSLQHGAKKVDLGIHGEDGHIIITVADDGRGVSKANADKIFNPFFTTFREQGGTGLGLTIVKTLLEAQQGEIQLLPSSKGATFRIKVPAAKA